MSAIENLTTYYKNKNVYKEWKANKDIEKDQKTAYLKKNPVSEANKRKDIERAKVVLNAVNTMDEYSQTKAEEMEQVTTTLSGVLLQICGILGPVLGMATAFITKSFDVVTEALEGNYKNVKKLLIPLIVTSIPILAITPFIKTFTAKKEVEASRLGRAEAMEKDLSSAKQFVILNEEQEKQVKDLSKDITVSDKEVKKSIDKGKGFGLISSIKTLIKPDQKLKDNIINHTKQVNQEINEAKNITLTEEEIENAKKDKQLLENIVEKIDTKSQDYAENTELVAGALTTAFLGTGGGLGLLLNAILKKLNVSGMRSKVIAGITGLVFSIVGTVYSTKLQKQASRVGRFVAKNELLNNPESLIYADEEKFKDINTNTNNKKQKKDNIFKRTIQILKDNKEFNQYVENNEKENIKRRKAIEKIDVSDEQLKEAKQLQHNVFKTFNKVDEKSQDFSESIEAVGEASTSIISSLSSIPVMLFGYKACESTETKNKFVQIVKIVGSLGAALLADMYITKQQKRASRVANMMAINELDDYRHYAPEEAYNPNNKNTTTGINQKSKALETYIKKQKASTN